MSQTALSKDQSTPADLSAVLEARDRRAAKRKALFSENQGCLLTVNLLMPGTKKTTRLSRGFLREYHSYLRKQLRGQSFSIVHEEVIADPCGDTCYFLFSAASDPYRLKHFIITMEEEFDWTRVLDLDLYISVNKQLSRADLKLAERSCLICTEKAHACGRSQQHSQAELQQIIRRYQTKGLMQLLPERMQAAALSAALSELLVAPKPGLVTASDSGSHSDMDSFTYADSIAALSGYFHAAASCGLQVALGEDPGIACEEASEVDRGFSKILSGLHRQGLRAERQMFAATGGVNTQKGFIYLSGLLLAAAAALSLDPLLFEATCGTESEAAVIAGWQEELIRWAVALQDFQICSSRAEETTGESLRRLYGISGIRGEAASGLEKVFHLALPFYRSLLQRELTQNEAAAVTLLLLLAAVEDTTLIKRAGLQQAQLIRLELGGFFDLMSREGALCPEKLQLESSRAGLITDRSELNHANALSTTCLNNIATQKTAVTTYMSLWSGYFRRKGYSAGGAADLLAICLLVLKLLADI